jgi:flavin-dependent dehydrogenase
MQRNWIGKSIGAEIHFNGNSFGLNRGKVAYIIDREVFDKELSEKLNIEYNTYLREVHPIKDGYLLKTNNGEYFAEMVVGADGPNSRVRKTLGFSSDMKLYRGYQYRIKTTPKHQNNSRAVPDCFDHNLANVGCLDIYIGTFI